MPLAFIVDSRAWFWPLAGACAGVYLFCRGFGMLQRKRLIMNTPASKIRSAAMGLVEVSGLATGPYTLCAPISGLPCYFYRSTAWQWKQQGKNGQWEKVADESMHVPFYLDDNTGRVLVNPQGADLDIHCDFRDEFSETLFSVNREISGNVVSFLLRNGVPTGRKLKVEEYCIKPKNALFILGTLATNSGLAVKPEPVRSDMTHQLKMSMNLPGGLVGTVGGALNLLPGVTASAGTTLTMFKGATGSQEISRLSDSSKSQPADKTQEANIAAALTKAGITSPRAWAAAGLDGSAAGTAVAVAPDTGAEQFDLHPPAVLMKGTHDPSFLISWQSQREVVKSLGWKSALMIWGGPALTVLCVYILAAAFGWL
jgi:hypothetical protein